MILSAMSPDMVESIVSLAQAQGTQLIALTQNTDTTVKPLAIASSEFVSDEDFPYFWEGLMLVFMAGFRRPMDFDFYEKVLIQALGAPAGMASKMAQTIDTWDPIAHTDVKGKKVSTVKWIYRKGAEYVRQAVNWLPRLLGLDWENDQKQDFDFDRLYEIRNLGKVGDELASRVRLMKGQERLLASLGISPAEAGDVYGDTVDHAEAQLVQAAQPLLGAPVPLKLFGKLADFVRVARNINLEELKQQINQAGLSADKSAVNPVKAQAAQRLLNGTSDSIAPAIVDASVTEIGDIINNRRSTTAVNGLAGDVIENIREEYGDAVAGLIEAGEIEHAYQEIHDMAKAPVTSGFPDLDDRIAGDVLAESGDIADLEVGSLFTKAKIKHKLRKAAKQKRKNTKKRTQRRNLARAQAKLDRARYQEPVDEFEEDDFTDQDFGDDQLSDVDTTQSAAVNGGTDMSDVDLSAGLEP